MKKMIKRHGTYPAALALAALLAVACARSAEPAKTEEAAKPETPAGTIQLTAEAVAAGGIAVEPVKEMPAVRRLAVSGELAFNARRLAHLSARAAGRLERVLAFKGDRVVRGQLLAEIYSPDYLALQAEFLQAAERAARLRGDAEEPAAASFLEAARRKLAPLGLDASDLEQLASDRTVRPLLAVRAPLSGTVVEAGPVAGDRVELETTLFKLADLSSLWAGLRIYEKDLAFARPGLEVRLRAHAYPGEEYTGRLVLLGDVMDDKTRTVEGRVEVANPSGRLKPGMYVEAVISSPEARTALVVSEAALQEYQNRTVVFVQSGPNRFVLRTVETAGRADGQVEISKGLAAGELVVTGGSFLLKSEMLKNSLGE